MGATGRAPVKNVFSRCTNNAADRYVFREKNIESLAFTLYLLLLITNILFAIAIIIGEDLGDVPDEVRVSLRRLGISATKVTASTLS